MKISLTKDAPAGALDEVPESWACVDCGRDTAPGFKTREQIERLFAEGAETVENTIDARAEVYSVRDVVWIEAAGMKPMGGCLCIGCLEKRLGRRLRPDDFPDHGFKSLPGTPRLMRRMWNAAPGAERRERTRRKATKTTAAKRTRS